jgi:hypothetical protein
MRKTESGVLYFLKCDSHDKKQNFICIALITHPREETGGKPFLNSGLFLAP